MNIAMTDKTSDFLSDEGGGNRLIPMESALYMARLNMMVHKPTP
jgi:hypothetical protein